MPRALYSMDRCIPNRVFDFLLPSVGQLSCLVVTSWTIIGPTSHSIHFLSNRLIIEYVVLSFQSQEYREGPRYRACAYMREGKCSPIHTNEILRSSDPNQCIFQAITVLSNSEIYWIIGSSTSVTISAHVCRSLHHRINSNPPS